jgi:hypothetical protein
LTVLVALASSVAGGFLVWLTTRMRIEHEREESLRTRMLNAADDYSLRATYAANALHKLVNVVEPEDVETEAGDLDEVVDELAAIKDGCDEARPVVDEARSQLPRVQLLFGADSASGQAALRLISNLTHVIEVLETLPPDIDFARAVFRQATEAHAVFTREARRALLRPSLRDVESPVTYR